MYNEKVMDVFKNPKNVGEIENPDGIGTVGNASCGDIMQISLKIEEEILSVVVSFSRITKTPLFKKPWLLISLLLGWLGWTAWELSALTIKELCKDTDTSKLIQAHILFNTSIKNEESAPSLVKLPISSLLKIHITLMFSSLLFSIKDCKAA